MKKPPHPMQPIENGRFVENAIVRRLLDDGVFDLNDIASWDAPDRDRVQFAQLIGYSLDGFGSLSYVDDETYEAAHLCRDGVGEEFARLEVLRETLDSIRQGLRAAATAAFKIHPEDLTD